MLTKIINNNKLSYCRQCSPNAAQGHSILILVPNSTWFRDVPDIQLRLWLARYTAIFYYPVPAKMLTATDIKLDILLTYKY